MMAYDKRVSYIEHAIQYISILNERFGAYTEDDDFDLDDIIVNLTGKEPLVWQSKSCNRKQCYSNMYSKLLLAYLISEIQNDNLLPPKFLRKFSNYQIEQWESFVYDDVGNQIGNVLTNIFLEVLKKDDIFYHRDISVGCPLEIDDVSQKIEFYLYQEIITECPDIDRHGIIQPSDFEMIAYFFIEDSDFCLHLDIVESSDLYKIYKAEEKKPTELGQRIIEQLKNIFPHITHFSPYHDLCYCGFDDEKEIFVSYAFSSSDILGDNEFQFPEILPSIHRFRYNLVFALTRLEEMVKLYNYKCKF